jgi:hypothetical protein
VPSPGGKQQGPPAKVGPLTTPRFEAWLCRGLASWCCMPLDMLSDPSFDGAVAAVALILSGLALWAATRSAVHAKRKADGLLGDLPPNLALYPAPKRAGAGPVLDDLILRIDNYNRRPIRITKVALQAPAKTGLVAYLLDGPRETLLAAGERRHDEVSTSVVLPGTPPGALQFSSSSLKLVLTGPLPAISRRRAIVRVAVQVAFEILQSEPEKRMQTISLEMSVERPRS